MSNLIELSEALLNVADAEAALLDANAPFPAYRDIDSLMREIATQMREQLVGITSQKFVVNFSDIPNHNEATCEYCADLARCDCESCVANRDLAEDDGEF